jgi:hypothetical protein
MTRAHHNNGDPVRRPDDKSAGIVQSQQPGNHVVVKWPNGTYSKHHASELISVCGTSQ